MNIRPLVFLTGFAALTAMSQAEPIAVGDDAPRITATNQDGQPVDLGALYDHGYVLVYFYPKADSPGCTAQACSLRDAYQDLTAHGITVVGVSTDTVKAQKAFEKHQSLPFTLIADPEHEVVNAFGVPLMGPGFATRQAFLIKDGKVVWRDLKASTTRQAADVLAAVSKLGPAAG